MRIVDSTLDLPSWPDLTSRAELYVGPESFYARSLFRSATVPHVWTEARTDVYNTPIFVALDDVDTEVQGATDVDFISSSSDLLRLVPSW